MTEVSSGPYDILLSDRTVEEGVPFGTVVGVFSALDDDPDAGYTYTLVDGEGASDNANFEIFEDELTTAFVADYDQLSLHSIRVRVEGQDGGFFEKVFVIGLRDNPGIVIWPRRDLRSVSVRIYDEGEYRIQVFTVSGKLLLETQYSNIGIYELDFDRYGASVYLIRTFTPGETLFQRVIHY